MKNYSWLIAFFAIIAISFAGFVSCDTGGGGGGALTVEITFNASNIEDGYFLSNLLGFKRVTIDQGGTVTPPNDAFMEGHKLNGWNTLPTGLGEMLTPSTTHYEDTTYYAIWEQNIFDVTQTWNITDDPTQVETNVNVWPLSVEMITKIKAAKYGSMLRLHFNAENGRGEDRNGWSIGSIGTATSSLDANVVSLWTKNNTPLIYYVDAEVEWLLDIIESDGDALKVFVPVNNGDILTQIQLLEPKENREPNTKPQPYPLPPGHGSVGDDGFVGTLTITYGYFGDPALGKGELTGDAIDLINYTFNHLAEDEKGILRVWVYNTLDINRASWGVGQINSVEILRGASGLSYYPNDISLERVVNELLVSRSSLDLNPYNSHAIVLVELWKNVPGSITIKLGDRDVGNIFVQGRSGTVTHFEDKTGYEFAATGSGHRGKYAWFELDFGAKRLSNYSEIKFKFELVETNSADPDRWLALYAGSTAIGNASLPSHPSGGSNLAPFLGSSWGYLVGGQVTERMGDEPLTNPELGEIVEISLKIDPSLTNVHNNSQRLFLSIYEHTAGSDGNGKNVIRISDIKFIERPEGSCPFCANLEDACTCGADITAAKTAVEALTFTTTQSHAGTETQAKEAAESIINALNLQGISAEIITSGGGFVQAVAGGADGSYTFTVKLTKGLGTPQTTSVKTMTITAMSADGELVWSLADFLVKFSSLTDISSSTSSYRPLRTSSSSTANIEVKVNRGGAGAADDHLDVTFGSTSHGLNIQVDNSHIENLNLNLMDNLYEIRVAGTAVTGGSVNLRYSGLVGIPNTNPFKQETVAEGSSFTITSELPMTTFNPTTTDHLLRISTGAAGTTVKITSIEIFYKGLRPCPGCDSETQPCPCSEDILAVKNLVEHATFPEAPSNTTIAAARTAVLDVINDLSLNGVTPTLSDEDFLASLPSVHGHFTFTVTLTKGFGTLQKTKALTLHLEAMPAGCPVDGANCTCTAAINAAKTLIEGTTFNAAHAEAISVAAAKTKVQLLLSEMALDGVVASVVGGSFTETSYTFTVNLSRGDGTPATTASKSMTIAALPDGQTVAFNLAAYLSTNFASGTGTFNSSSARPMRLTSSAMTGSTVLDGGININKSTVEQYDYSGINLFVHGGSSGDLNLNNQENIIELTVSGSVIGTPPADAQVWVSENTGDIFTFKSPVLAEDDVFIITGELPLTFLRNGTTSTIRIRTNTDNHKMDFRITNIVLVNKGARPADELIAAAKPVVEGAAYAVKQSVAEDIAAAKTAAQALVNALNLYSVTATVVDGTFIAAVANTSNGSYTFTVELTKGDGTKVTTTEQTMIINYTSDEDDIANVKSAIEGFTFLTHEHYITSAADAKAIVQRAVSVMDLKGVSAVVNEGSYTAVSGATDGSLAFTVTLNKGSAAQAVTASKTLTITALPTGATVAWTLADYLARTETAAFPTHTWNAAYPADSSGRTSNMPLAEKLDGMKGMGNASAYQWLPFGFSSTNPASYLCVTDLSSVYITTTSSSGATRIMIDSTGLNLDTTNRNYQLRINGSNILPTGNSSFSIRYTSSAIIVANTSYASAFNLSASLAATTTTYFEIYPGATPLQIRIDSIEIIDLGPR